MQHLRKLHLPLAIAALSALGTVFSTGGAHAQLLASNGTGAITYFDLTTAASNTYLNLGAGNNIGGIAAGADGYLYIGDTVGSGSTTNLIKRYDPTSNTTTTFATLAGGAGTDVSQIAFDPSGNLYAVTRSSVQKVTPAGVVSTLFQTNGSVFVNNGTGLGYDAGFVYVGDAGQNSNNNGRLLKIDANTGAASVIVNGYKDPGYTDPQGIAIRSDAGTTYLYTVAYGDTGVQRRTTTGGLATFDVSGGPLVNPTGDLFDNSNNLFVADSGNNRLVKYNANINANGAGGYGTAVVFAGISAPRYLSLVSSGVAAAPEPAAWVGLVVGAMGLGGLRLRARRRSSLA